MRGVGRIEWDEGRGTVPVYRDGLIMMMLIAAIGVGGGWVTGGWWVAGEW